MILFYRLFLSLSLSIVLSFHVAAQVFVQPVYKKVRIDLGDRSLGELARLGVEADHGYNRVRNTLTNMYTETDLKLISDAGFKFTILSEDVIKAYLLESAKAEEQVHLELRNDECDHQITTYKTPTNFHYGSMGYYLTYNEILNELDLMRTKYPNLISQRAHNVNFKTKRGNYVDYVKISDNPDQNEMGSEKQILYTALHHSKEPMSMMQMIYFMWYILENYNSNPEIKYLLDNTELFFMPCVNPDGYLYNQLSNPNGGGLWRKNRNYDIENPEGVDLNRNYGYYWGYDNTGSSPNPTSETYRGSDDFSEQETKAVRSFIITNELSLVINYHAFANEIIYPWGYSGNGTLDSTTFIQFADHLSKKTDYGYGLNNEVLDYQVNGTSDDWIYSQSSGSRPIISFTTECGGEEDDETNSFWPTVNKIIPICDALLSQNLRSMWLVHNKVDYQLTSEKIVSGSSDTLHIRALRLGLENNPVQITIKPIGSEMQSFNYQYTFSGKHLSEIDLSVPYLVIKPNVQKLSFQILTDYGTYTSMDTIQVQVLKTKVLFVADGNDLSLFRYLSPEQNWTISATTAYNDTKSFAVSREDKYEKGSDKQLITKDPITLPAGEKSILTFFGNWFIEKNVDYLRVAISEDGLFWNPLCGDITTPGSLDQFTGEPVLDGFHPYWENVVMDLSEYAGKSVYLRFLFRSDARWNKGGVYIDKIRVLTTGTTSESKNTSISDIKIYPNPADENLFIEGEFDGSQILKLMDTQGQIIYTGSLLAGKNTLHLSTFNLKPGLYFFCILRNGEIRNSGKLNVN